MAIMLGTLPVSVAFATTDGGDGDDTTAAPQITEYPLFDENFNGATPGGELNKSNAPEKNVFSNISNGVKPTEGDGSPAFPFLITTAAELIWANEKINGTVALADGEKDIYTTAQYKLGGNIDLGGVTWIPLGSVGREFRGVFDGNKYAVSNFTVDGKTGGPDIIYKNVGFFGKTASTALVKNLGIIDADVSVQSQSRPNRLNAAGGMVGYAQGKFINCYVKDSIVRNTDAGQNSDTGVGGFAGYIDADTTIENCYTKGLKISGDNIRPIGGFYAKAKNSETINITNCYSVGCTAGVQKSAIYGFGAVDLGNDTEVKIKVNNCCSDMTTMPAVVSDGSQVTNDVVKKCNTGTTPLDDVFLADGEVSPVVDKNTIKSALVKESDPYCQFMADSETVNDGYPIHSFVPTKDEEAINDIITNWLDPQVTPYEEYNHMKGFNVPVEYPDDEAVSLSWDTTDGSALSVDPITGYVAITPSTSGMNTVYMTAVFERNGTTVYKSYTIRIKKLVVTTVTVTTANGAITPTVSENTTDSSKDDHSITVDYANLAEKGVTEITFMAVIQDADGEITNVGETSVAVADNNATSEDLLVTLPKAQGTDIVKYYLWDQNHVSLIDNAPTDVIGFSTKSNTSGVSLAWDRSYDDSGIDVIYKLETDGDEINREELSAAEFNKDTLKVEFDKIIDGDDYKEKAFRIIPFDNIGQIAAKSAEERNKKYKWFESSVNAMDEAVNDGLKFVASGGTDNRAKILDGHFVNVPHATSSGNTTYIFFGVSSADGRDKLTSNDNDVIIEVTYKNTSLKAAAIVYKPITGGDNGNRKEACSLPVTEDYSTVTVRVTDASPDNLMTDSSSFGIKVGGNTSENTVQIKSIKVVRTSNYPNGDEITPVN